MKAIVILAMVLATAAGATAANFRCAGDFIQPGYDSYTVWRKCGEPVHRKLIGFKLTAEGNREAKVERWIYGPDNGWYYHLKFEGGKLTEIEEIRE